MSGNCGWNMGNMICPVDEDLNPRGGFLMQLTKCKNSVKGTVESVHLWISLADARQWKNKDGEYYVIKSGVEEYFSQCAVIINLIQEQAPQPIIITINTTADIFAWNEPLKQTASVGVQIPSILEGDSAVPGNEGQLTTETEGLTR